MKTCPAQLSELRSILTYTHEGSSFFFFFLPTLTYTDFFQECNYHVNQSNAVPGFLRNFIRAAYHFRAAAG